jgi:hypothetical protein
MRTETPKTHEQLAGGELAAAIQAAAAFWLVVPGLGQLQLSRAGVLELFFACPPLRGYASQSGQTLWLHTSPEKAAA